MYVKFKQFNNSGTVVRAGYTADAAADVILTTDVVLGPGETRVIPLGFGVKVPYNFVGQLFPRTSTAKFGVHVAACPIDPGYTGEVHGIFTNLTQELVVLKAGKGCCQLLIQPFQSCNFVPADDWSECMGPRRGQKAFGSSNKPEPLPLPDEATEVTPEPEQLKLPFDDATE
jgi:dUTPase